jgi:hypothetical protein
MSEEAVRLVGDVQAEIDRLVVETAEGLGDWTAEGIRLAKGAKLDVEEVTARFTVAREVAEELGSIKSAPAAAEAIAREDAALDACVQGDDAPKPSAAPIKLRSMKTMAAAVAPITVKSPVVLKPAESVLDRPVPKPWPNDWASLEVPEGANEIDRLTYVPGVVGKITNWIHAGARRQNRMMAFAVGLGVPGTLIGRRVEGPTQNATHLYLMIVGTSGAGKDHSLTMGEDLMRSVGAGALLGPQTFGSAPGFLKDLVKQPLQLLLMDEIGDEWKLIGSQGQNLFVSMIFGELKKAYNSFKIVRTAATVTRDSAEIICPAVTIVGASTPKKFWTGLTPAEFEDGFVNRMMILPNMGLRPPERLVPREALMVPVALTTELKKLYVPMSVLDQKPELGVRATVIGWGPGAAEVYSAYSARIDRLEEAGRPGEFNLAIRGCENAVRIATIIAVGRGSALVEREDIERGIALAEISIETALGGKDKFVKTYFEYPEMCEELATFYQEAGGPVSDRDLDRKFGRNQKWAGILDKAKDQLRREGRIKYTNCSALQNSPGYEWVKEG